MRKIILEEDIEIKSIINEKKLLNEIVDIVLKEDVGIDIDISEEMLSHCVYHLSRLDEKEYKIILNTFCEKILKLKELFKILKEDCEVKRTTAKMLSDCCKLDIFNIIIDKEDFFKNLLCNIKGDLKRSSTRFSICEKAALVSSVNIFDALVDEKCNPSRCPSFIEYTLCAGDNERTKYVIEKYKVDVTKTLFSLYSIRTKNLEMQSFSVKEENERENKKKSLSRNIENSVFSNNKKKERQKEPLEFIKKLIEDIDNDKNLRSLEYLKKLLENISSSENPESECKQIYEDHYGKINNKHTIENKNN